MLGAAIAAGDTIPVSANTLIQQVYDTLEQMDDHLQFGERKTYRKALEYAEQNYMKARQLGARVDSLERALRVARKVYEMTEW